MEILLWGFSMYSNLIITIKIMIIKKIKLKIITNNNSKIILGHFYVVCNKWLLNQQAVMEGGYSGKIL